MVVQSLTRPGGGRAGAWALGVVVLAVVGSVPLLFAEPQTSKKRKAPPGPLTAKELQAVVKLSKAKTCSTCHKHTEEVGLLQAPGFLRTSKTLRTRLEPKAYRAQIRALEKSDPARAKANKKTYHGILAATDARQRSVRWLRAYLRDPRFDDPDNRMAPVTLDKKEIELLARYIAHLYSPPTSQPRSRPR